MKNSKKIIRLTEDDIRQIVLASVQQCLNEEVDEGWFGDKWNQVKTAANTVKGNYQGGQGIGQTIKNATTNWKTQGQLNDLNNLKQQLSQFIDDGKLNPNMTIAQLVGGKYNNNKFGKLSGMIGNRQAQINNKGGQYN